MKNWKNFYGGLTTGSGSLLGKDSLFSYGDKAINLYKKSILKNLKITKIPIKNNYNILDVGTGRQALAFSQISNGNIDHIDLSHIHVQKTKRTAKKNKIKNINSIQQNLDNCKKFKKETYDLIYLQGIIQHFKNPQTTLENILSSLKVGGYAWLYIYKSGTYRQYVDHLIRNSIKNISKKPPSIKDIQKIKKFLSLKKYNKFEVDSFIDGIFTKFSWLYNNNQIMKCFVQSGFKIIHKKSCYKKKQHYDHSDKWGAFIFSIKKTNDKKIKLKSLNPKKSCKEPLRQYTKNKSITRTEKLLYELMNTKLSKNEKIDNLFKLFSISHANNVNKKTNLKHEPLQKFLIKKLNEKKIT
tara:strand:+ start:352 stop:1413 length:1062 start_codon:yes stop_codon:yes gene_type:complete